VTGDQTLTIDKSGKIFFVGTEGVDFTLPTVSTANGVHYKFVISANFANTDITVITGNSLENVIQGVFDVDNTLTAVVVARDTVSFAFGAETIGDYIEVWSDGSNWFVTGQGLATGALTSAQAD